MTTRPARGANPADAYAGDRAARRPARRSAPRTSWTSSIVPSDGIPSKEAMRWKPPQVARGRDETARRARRGPATLPRDVGLDPDLSLGLRTSGSRTVTRSAILAGTRPEWAMADLASAGARRRHLPDLPGPRPGQVAFIINNVTAVAVVVENAQQAAKVESVRAECRPSATVISDRGARQVRRRERSRSRTSWPAPTQDPSRRRLWREGWLADPAGAAGDDDPYLRHDGESPGRDAQPRERALQLRGGQPGGRLLPDRYLPLVPAAQPHLRAGSSARWSRSAAARPSSTPRR